MVSQSEFHFLGVWFFVFSLRREKTKVAKVSPGVEDGPDTKKAKLDSSETTMVKKVSGKNLCGDLRGPNCVSVWPRESQRGYPGSSAVF